jgi:two-component system, sensor histidine kinase ChiS
VREQPGSGLGLTIARNLIEMQGGEMTVASEKGKGTTFSFTMPVSE